MKNLKRIAKPITTPWKDNYVPLSPGLKALRNVAEENHIPIIRRDTESFFIEFIKKNKINSILEIGTAIGYSAIFFANLIPDGFVYSIEKDEYALSIARHNIELNEVDERIKLLPGDALMSMDALIDESDLKFDMIFIDGAKSHYKMLLDRSTRLVNHGGYIICDDIWQRGITLKNTEEIARKHRTSAKNMQKFLEYLDVCDYLDTVLYDIGDGLSVSKYIENE